MKKKFIILGVLLLAFFTLIFLLRNSDEKEPDTKSNPLEEKIEVIENSPGDLPVKIKEQQNFNIPTNLNLVTYRYKRLSLDISKALATNLGFEGEPTIISDINLGASYIWTTDNSSLWITPSISEVKYYMKGTELNKTGINLTDSESERKSRDFLNKTGLSDDMIVLTSIQYLRVGDSDDAGFITGTKNNSQLIQVNFTYKEVGYPLLTNIPQFPVIYVQLTPTGEIFRSTNHLFDRFEASTLNYEIKDFDDIKNNIKEAKLISVENEFTSTQEITKSDISTINVDKLQLAYLYDSNLRSRTFIPVFLLSGEIKIKNSTATYAHLYLPASK